MVGIGIPSTIGGLIYIGRKLQILDDLKIEFAEMKNDIKYIALFLSKKFNDFSIQNINSFSPAVLNENGWNTIKKLNFEGIFAENKRKFFDEITKTEPKLKYDVEKSAIMSIYILSENDFMKPLKIYMYNNPFEKMTDLASIMGIYIRDKYLAEHPEIKE